MTKKQTLQQEIVNGVIDNKKLLRRINPQVPIEYVQKRLKDAMTKISYALQGFEIVDERRNGTPVVNGKPVIQTKDGLAFVQNQDGHTIQMADGPAALPMQTVYVHPRVREYRYKYLDYRESVPIKNDYAPGATEILYDWIDYIGGSTPDAESNTNIEMVEVVYSDQRVPVRKESNEYLITTEQMQQMINYGTAVPIHKARGHFRVNEEFFHKNCMIGSTLHNYGGLLNHANVPEVSSNGTKP